MISRFLQIKFHNIHWIFIMLPSLHIIYSIRWQTLCDHQLWYTVCFANMFAYMVDTIKQHIKFHAFNNWNNWRRPVKCMTYKSNMATANCEVRHVFFYNLIFMQMKCGRNILLNNKVWTGLSPIQIIYPSLDHFTWNLTTAVLICFACTHAYLHIFCVSCYSTNLLHRTSFVLDLCISCLNISNASP